jgi:hypothetical protein
LNCVFLSKFCAAYCFDGMDRFSPYGNPDSILAVVPGLEQTFLG